MREQIKDVDRLRHIEECVCLTEVEKETSSYHHQRGYRGRKHEKEASFRPRCFSVSMNNRDGDLKFPTHSSRILALANDQRSSVKFG